MVDDLEYCPTFLHGLFVLHLIKVGDEAKALKGEYTQLHSVQYGLFNSSVWADKIAAVVEEKLMNLTLQKAAAPR